ncbi:AAA family ATPase [Phaeobacter inhibens]|uniref:AAA family ATPase n=1 Tax=Phaeobacter inhibens TaxID=221822 RepID=UPI000421F343|nr:AAA family ATPase [Phaeobacter inhibens]
MAVLICFSGLPGVGKSTIARRLSKKSGAIWLRLDEIETAMRKSHMEPVDLADAGYAAAQVMAKAALSQGYLVIADCVNPIALTREQWRKVSQDVGVAHLDIALTCSDPVQHRCRVETRKPDVSGQNLPTWDAVEQRCFEPFPQASLSIDTAETTVDDAVEIIWRQIKVL